MLTDTWRVSRSRPRLLLLAAYPLDQGVWGPVARITRLRDELSRLAELDVIAGYRGPRRRAAWLYAFSGRLRGLDGIYVEGSSGFPAVSDLAFMALAKILGIPVLTYIRDAQYLYPDDYRPSLKRRIARHLFRPAIRVLRAASTHTAYPSPGLVSALRHRMADAVLLPPGSPPPADAPLRPDASTLLYVGSMKYPITGYDILFAAVDRLRSEGRELDLVCFCRPADEPPRPWPDWLRVERGSWPEIVDRLPGVVATVQPRHRSAYSDLGVPIKLMEYLSYGRPIVATDCTETARIIEEARCGIVVEDTAEDFAAGLRLLLDGAPAEAERWADNARKAAIGSSWAVTAGRIMGILIPNR